MEFCKLVERLPQKKSAVYSFERGKTVCHPYARLADDIDRAKNCLISWGVKAGTRVGIYAPNSYAWLVHDLALIEIGAISVPFTDDFAGRINDELLERYHIALLLVSKSQARLFPHKPAHVAFLDDENENVRALECTAPEEDDQADQHSLVFSSGSAGGLKGLVISRKGVELTLPPIMRAIGLKPADRLLLFLPMSNFQQRNMCYTALWYDFDIIITDYSQLFAAMKALNPTILIAPPVLYQMVYSEFEKLSVWRRSLAMSIGSAAYLLPAKTLRRYLLGLAFGELYRQFGERMRILVTGMAPIKRNVARLFERMHIPLCESYGMVEAGSITYRSASSKNFGSVGKLLEGVTVSFESDGEIIVHRDTPMTLRYFQCAEGENERTFIGPGTIATGDIGEIDSEGNLYLRGRKKELIITPGGYKIHPEVIEQELNSCPDVSQSVVFLKPNASHLTCVVDLVAPTDENAKARVRKFVNSLQSTKKVVQFVEVIFTVAPFSKENGMLRPNLKIDRKAVAARYL